MNITANRLMLAFGLLILMTSCTAASNSSIQPQQQLSQQLIKIDGSSTVFPITDAIAKEFQKTRTDKVQVTVDISGTGGGFKKFCAGETDISNASRPILTAEMKACNSSSVRYIELPIAYDALTVVIHPTNDWAKSITTDELRKMWSPSAQGKITRWKQVRPDWPDQPLKLYGAGKQSGTFDYFTEAIVGKTRASRSDYIASEDDDVLVQGVSKDPNALGYFGFAYYEANLNKLKAVAVDNGKEAVLPSRQTVEKAQYQPLSRPLFIYVNAKAAQTKPAVKNFVDF
jgi:phosphate transport system substrate-binding protein